MEIKVDRDLWERETEDIETIDTAFGNLPKNDRQIVWRIESMLKGSKKHAIQMLETLRKFYTIESEEDIPPLEISGYDLVDEERKIVAEVGKTGIQEWRFTGFIVGQEIENPEQWTYIHNSYDTDYISIYYPKEKLYTTIRDKNGYEWFRRTYKK